MTEKEENVCNKCQKKKNNPKQCLTSLVYQETTNISVEILFHTRQTGKYQGGISKS